MIRTLAATLATLVLTAAAGWWYFSQPSVLPLAAPVLADPEGAARARAAWNGTRAMDDIRTLVTYAPRSPGTPGQASTLAYIERELSKAGVAVTRESWTYRRDDGVDLPLTNVIGHWEAARPTRLILGTHHDSLVRAYRDARHPDAPMPGANNSASGVALLLETARVIGSGGVGDTGIDFVFFDGEEGPYGLAGARLPWTPLGSTHFVENLNRHYPRTLPAVVAIFDLVCRSDLLLSPEPASIDAAPGEVRAFWSLGAATAPRTFTTIISGVVQDDHTPFINAGLRAFLVIDFRTTPWFNTTEDTIDKCSAQSLTALGQTLMSFVHVARGVVP